MTDYDKDKAEFFKDARTDLTGPLAGIRVIEVTTTIAGPRCGSMFAGYGADVIRVELRRSPDIARFIPPMIPDTNPPESHSHASINSDKRSITLDLRRPEAQDVFKKIIAKADVLVENFKKGSMAAMGLGYDDLRAAKEDLVYISITGYGQFGPYSDRPGYDPAIQALTGIVHMNAPDADTTPMRMPIYIADELAGLHGCIAALSALRHRDATGEGQHVDVSLIDCLMESSTGLHTQAAHNLPTPPTGNSIPYAAPANLYQCTDGYVFAGVLLDTHWCVLAKLIGHPELAEDENFNQMRNRLMNREKADALLAEYCADKTRDEVVEAFSSHGLTATPVLSPHEAVKNRHIVARGAIETLKHPCGADVKVTAPPAKFSRTPAHHRTVAPALGAHTDEVLEEAGISAEERQELRDNGVI